MIWNERATLNKLTDSSRSSQYGPSALICVSALEGSGEINGELGATNADLTAIWPLIDVAVVFNVASFSGTSTRSTLDSSVVCVVSSSLA